jgi:hypothetical protein
VTLTVLGAQAAATPRMNAVLTTILNLVICSSSDTMRKRSVPRGDIY